MAACASARFVMPQIFTRVLIFDLRLMIYDFFRAGIAGNAGILPASYILSASRRLEASAPGTRKS
jgi:hypothetical protein